MLAVCDMMWWSGVILYDVIIAMFQQLLSEGLDSKDCMMNFLGLVYVIFFH